jgi:hypothetical protein
MIAIRRTTVLLLLILPLQATAGEMLCEESAAHLAARAYALALPVLPREMLERHVSENINAFKRGGGAQHCLEIMGKAVQVEGFANLPADYDQAYWARTFEKMTPDAITEISQGTRSSLQALLLDENTVTGELFWLARVTALGVSGDWASYDEPKTRSRSRLYRKRPALDAICAGNDQRCTEYRRQLKGFAALSEKRMLLLALGGLEKDEPKAAAKDKQSGFLGFGSVGAKKPVMKPVMPAPRPKPPAASIEIPTSTSGTVPTRGDGSKYSTGQESTTSSTVQGIPSFPWPPPRFSSRAEISRDFFAADNRLGEVADTLEHALERAGHVEWSYYSVPKGFALATRLENLNSDGSPKSDRWASTVGLGRNFSIIDYLRALFTAPAGYFRIIVFTVTSEPFTPTEVGPTREQAMGWISLGGTGLPRAIAEIPFGPDYECLALVYEFEKRESEGEAITLVPGRYPGRVHLQKSKVWEGLRP